MRLHGLFGVRALLPLLILCGSALAQNGKQVQKGAPLPPAERGLPIGDECDSALEIGGLGLFAFDTAAATDSFYPGDPMPVRRDRWYTWTAPGTGRYRVSTCGLTSLATRIVVYDASGCGIVPFNAISEGGSGYDVCGPQSYVVFNTSGGGPYLIRIGEDPASPDTGGGAGMFRIGQIGASTTIYVDPNSPGGDGSSWDAALDTFEEAMDAANLTGFATNVTVRLADGVYSPTRASSVFSHFNLNILGGFAGFGAPDPDALINYPFGTVVSGDRNGDDGADFANREDNLDRLLAVELRDNDTVTLDGIRFANTGRFGAAGQAVNVYRPSGSPGGQLNVLYCGFERNLSDDGSGQGQGAGLMLGTPPMLTPFSAFIFNAAFEENRAALRGGGLCMLGNHAVDIRDTAFFSNSVIGTGAGSSPSGGGLYADAAAMTIVGCDFGGNSASASGLADGGGMAIVGGATARISKTKFRFNSADSNGGAILHTGAPAQSLELVSCAFHDNYAPRGGGLYHVAPNNLELVNGYFFRNVADDGSAIFRVSTAPVPGGLTEMQNCTVFKNFCFMPTGVAMRTVHAPFPLLTLAYNCIFWGNRTRSDPSGALQLTPSPFNSINSSIVQNHGGMYSGAEISGADPRILDDPFLAGPDGVPGTPDDFGVLSFTYMMAPGSGAVDAGDNARIPSDALGVDSDGNTAEPLPLDLDFGVRRGDDPFTVDTGFGPAPIVDMGAVERSAFAPRMRVRTTGGTWNDGAEWFPLAAPGRNDVALLYGASQTIDVSPSSFAGQLVVSGGFASLTGAPSRVLTVGQPRYDAVLVGPWAGAPAELAIANTVDVPNGGVQIGLFGEPGNGTLTVFSSGVLSVGGDRVNVSSGELKLQFGGTVITDLIGFGLDSRMTVDTAGTVVGSVLNIGALDMTGLVTSREERGPTLEQPATLRISGDYYQTGFDELMRPNSGALSMRIGGPNPGQYDQLDVAGQIYLGGALNIRMMNGYAPAPTDSVRWSLFTTGSAVYSRALTPQEIHAHDLTGSGGALRDSERQPLSRIVGRFDVVNMPGLPDGRFLRIEYSSSGEVAMVADLLQRVIGLQPPASFSTPGAPRNAALGDLNGDGFPELAVTIPGATVDDPGDVVVLVNAGTTEGGMWQEFDSGATVQLAVGRNPVAVAIADFDGDALNDLAVLLNGDDAYQVLLNTTPVRGLTIPPTFIATAPRPAGDDPRDIAAADFSGDGRADVTTVGLDGEGAGSVFVAVNQGGAPGMWGGFAPVQATPTGGQPSSIEPSDMDDDKDIDAVVVGAGGTGLLILPNQGGAARGWGGFAAPVLVDGGPQPTSIEPVDMDDDKDIDAIVTNPAAGTISLIINQGGLAFRPPAATAAGEAPMSVTTADLDADGDFDVAIVTEVGGTRELMVLRNDLASQAVTFTPVPAPNLGAEPILVLSGNMDGDADEDLVTINGQTGGPRGTAPPARSVSVVLSTPACVADADGDGTVGQSDAQMILQFWNQEVLPGTFGDVDRDGRVTLRDLARVILSWGASC